MTNKTRTIECPNCEFEIDISDVLYHQVEEDLKKQFKSELKKDREKFAYDAADLKLERQQLEKQISDQKEIVEQSVQDMLQKQKTELSKKITKKVKDEQSEQIQSMQEELETKSKQVKQLNKAQADIARLKREKDEAESKAEADAERKLNTMLIEEKVKIRKAEEEKSSLKVADKDHVINQLNEKLKDMQRKAEQGSMQTQGEVQELAIEAWLADTYPLDTIEEIKKGAKGGDCIQTINTRTAEFCGRIYYESKRTKAFHATWIEKFKTDMREKDVGMGVLVTETMPADMPRMGLMSGVWVCSFAEFKGLSNVLRESLISIHGVAAQQENKGEKMSLVYDFLTSNAFKMQVEAIVEGFTQMQTDLNSEKRAMASIWKKREKQIEKVLLNTSDMYSSIKGLAGSAIPVVKQLELPEPLDTELTATEDEL